MGLDRCIFLARGAPQDREALAGRAERIAAWLRPLAPSLSLETHWVPELNALAGVVDFRGQEHDWATAAVWGDSIAGDAGHEALRATRGVYGAIGVGGDTARVVTGATGITSLFHSRAGTTEAWSSHAVAASVLATGTAELDWTRLPEFLALEFVIGSGTLVKHVEAVEPGQVATISATGTDVTSFWPAEERWERIPESHAREHAERALLEHLAAVLDTRRAALGLTAGSDSGVVAAALCELGAEVSAFTWGDPAWPDVEGARAVAAAAGLRHRVYPVAADAGSVIDAARLVARWSEGMLPPGIAETPWPTADVDVLVTGAGGEVGRAFYWRNAAASFPRVRPAQLVAATPFPRTLALARRADRTLVLDRLEQAILSFVDLGLDGWRPLDAFYAEQRLAHWGRARVPALPVAFVPAFAWPEISRALAWLPTGDRLRDGFHRRFMAQRLPAQLVPPEPALQRRMVPPPVRRLAASARALRQRLRPQAGDLGRILDSSPEVRAWVEAGLERPELRSALGDRWVDGVRSGFRARATEASQQALLARGALSFADELDRIGQ